MNRAKITPGLVCWILCAAAACAAQQPAPSGTHGLGGPVTPPSVLAKVQPEYSEEARLARFEGTVLLRIVVGTDGKARDLKVVRGVGLGLDETAVTAVSKWQFQPGAKDGQAVNVQAQVAVNFRLLDNGSKPARWHLARVDFHLQPGVSRPVIAKTAVPQVVEDPVKATATLTFDVDEKGAPVNIQVGTSSDDEWARTVSEVLGQWKFTPGSQNGNPVSVPCSMDFVRGN
jgi:TonB family protein